MLDCGQLHIDHNSQYLQLIQILYIVIIVLPLLLLAHLWSLIF